MDNSPLRLARAVAAVLAGDSSPRAALATVTQRTGSAPQVVGAKLLMLDDGTVLGTVGGGTIESRVLDACRETIRFGRPRVVEANLVRDLGMCCGGTMQVFVEYLEARARLFIVGAGHVAQALAPLAESVAFRVTVMDDREDLLAHPSFADIETAAYDADELDAAIPDLQPRDYVVVVTRDHARDEQAIARLLERPHAYLGMIGSRRKVHAVLGRILRRYDDRGRERPDLSCLHAPVGLALGGRTPREIAVSIVAELVAHRNGGDGTAMSVVPQAVARIDARDEAG